MTERQRLPNRRLAETFNFEADGLHYVASIGRFAMGVGEIFLGNARDSAIACSIALQFGADIEVVRRALCRDAQGRALGPLGVALDLIAESAL